MNDKSDDDEESTPNLRDVISVIGGAVPFPNPYHLFKAGLKGLDGAFEAVRFALEADEEATVEVLKNHEDPIQTLSKLARIMRGDDFPADEDGDVDVGD